MLLETKAKNAQKDAIRTVHGKFYQSRCR